MFLEKNFKLMNFTYFTTCVKTMGYILIFTKYVILGLKDKYFELDSKLNSLSGPLYLYGLYCFEVLPLAGGSVLGYIEEDVLGYL